MKLKVLKGGRSWRKSHTNSQDTVLLLHSCFSNFPLFEKETLLNRLPPVLACVSSRHTALLALLSWTEAVWRYQLRFDRPSEGLLMTCAGTAVTRHASSFPVNKSEWVRCSVLTKWDVKREETVNAEESYAALQDTLSDLFVRPSEVAIQYS